MRARNRRLMVAAGVLVLAPALSWGAGFALYEHGNRAMAMGGAFTAVADDPAALYWNPAGAAFQAEEGFKVMAGATLIFVGDQTFTGDSPYPGEGYEAEQKSQVFYPPHLHMIYPINDDMTFNFGVMTPFGLGTWWEEDHAGRFLSKRADLKVMDFSPSLSLQLNDGIAVGVGIDYLIGQIDLTRQIGVLNPYTQQVADVGQVHMYTDGMGNDAWGWNVSVLAKSENGFSFGALYRSGFKITYEGEASFTQYLTGYDDFDAAVAGMLPFDENAELGTEIEFPDMWTMGVAYSRDKVTVSGQYGHIGWSSFQSLAIEFTDYPYLNGETEENYVNVDQYRLGFEYEASEAWAFQAGALYDNTPQPPESMSPLLGDGDRTGASLGLSWVHGKMRADLGYLYLWFDERSTGGQQLEGYDGTYETSAMLFGASLTLTF